MARTVTIPSQIYAAGAVVQGSLDDFPGNIRSLTMTITREPAGAWPGVPDNDVMTVSVNWDDGSGGTWTLPGGTVQDKEGNTLLQHTVQAGVPRTGQGAKNVVGGTYRVEIHQQLQTTITVEAKAGN